MFRKKKDDISIDELEEKLDIVTKELEELYKEDLNDCIKRGCKYLAYVNDKKFPEKFFKRMGYKTLKKAGVLYIIVDEDFDIKSDIKIFIRLRNKMLFYVVLFWINIAVIVSLIILYTIIDLPGTFILIILLLGEATHLTFKEISGLKSKLEELYYCVY